MKKNSLFIFLFLFLSCSNNIEDNVKETHEGEIHVDLDLTTNKPNERMGLNDTLFNELKKIFSLRLNDGNVQKFRVGYNLSETGYGKSEIELNLVNRKLNIDYSCSYAGPKDLYIEGIGYGHSKITDNHTLTFSVEDFSVNTIEKFRTEFHEGKRITTAMMLQKVKELRLVSKITPIDGNLDGKYVGGTQLPSGEINLYIKKSNPNNLNIEIKIGDINEIAYTEVHGTIKIDINSSPQLIKLFKLNPINDEPQNNQEQIPTIYTTGGKDFVNWNDIMSEYEDPEWDGPGFWETCIMAPDNAKASSTLSPQGSYNYYAKNLMDYNPKTAWVEGRKDYGIGEYFEVNLLSYSEVYIYNGYQSSHKSWKDNSRVKKFKIYGDEKPLCYLVLSDKMGGQSFKLPENNYENFRFEILSVYQGDKWKDVAISEIHSKGCCLNINTQILSNNKSTSISDLKKGNQISYFNHNEDKIIVAEIVKTAKQIHHTLLKVSTKNKTIELTPTHPLHFKNHGSISLYDLKKKFKRNNYQDLKENLEVLIWNNEKQKSEYQKIIEIKKINGEFETHTILDLNIGKTYIANGFITSVY